MVRVPLPEFLEALVNVGQAVGQAVACWLRACVGGELLDGRKGPAEDTEVDAAAVVRAVHPVREAKAGALPCKGRAEAGWRRQRRAIELPADVGHASRRYE